MAQEKKTQNEIMREFATRPDLRIWRQNVGKAVPLSFLQLVRGELMAGNFSKALQLIESPPVTSFGFPGQADLSGILPDGRRLEIEVKSPNGRQSKPQKVFQRVIERFGGLYILARNCEDVADKINEGGLYE